MSDIFDDFGAINPPQLVAMVNELSDGGSVIVNDDDRVFVEGVKLLIDMEEQVPVKDAQRIQLIYIAFKQTLHAGLKPE
jgi:hypothetical protein